MDWLVTYRFNDMPEDADEDSMRTFASVLLSNNMADDVLADTEIVKIERVPDA